MPSGRLAVRKSRLNLSTLGSVIPRNHKMEVYFREMRRRPFKTFLKSGEAHSLPAYRIVEAARYLNIPTSTLRLWVSGQRYQTQAGPRFFRNGAVSLLIVPRLHNRKRG